MEQTSAGATTSGEKPAYTPYPTFKGFITKLHDTGVPHRIDKTVMSNLSGAAQSHLIGALRFLGLISGDGSVKPTLQKLADAATTDQWSAVLASTIHGAYDPLIGDLDLQKITRGQLQESFRTAGADGTTIDKGIRFFLKALDEAKIPYSNHFPKMRARASGGKRRRADSSTDPGGGDNPPPPPGSAGGGGTPRQNLSGMISFPIHLPGRQAGTITVPSDVSEADVPLIDAAIAYIRLYAQRAKGGVDQ